MKKGILKDALANKYLIGFRTNEQDWDELIIGFIVQLEDSFFTVNEIDEDGFFIGKTTFNIDRIINLVVNDRYLIRLQFIHDNISNFDKNKQITIWNEGVMLSPHIENLISNKAIATLYFDDDNYVTGKICKFDSDYIMIENIGVEGDKDGISFYPIDALVGVRFDGINEQKIKLLYENKGIFDAKINNKH